MKKTVINIIGIGMNELILTLNISNSRFENAMFLVRLGTVKTKNI
jgi:hypothetical protein